jgi:outer membrane autotransporter protein
LHGTLATLGLQHTSQLVQLVNRRLRSPIQPSGFGGGFEMSENADLAMGEPVIRLVSYDDESHESLVQRRARTRKARDGWMLGYRLGGEASSDGNAAGADDAFGGTLFGVNHWLGTEAMIGMYGGYSQTHVHTSGPDQDAQVDSAQVGGYLRHGARNGYWLANAGLGYDDYQTTRRVSFGAIDRTAQADYSGQQAIAYLERGFNGSWKEASVKPLAALQYIYNHQNNFTETGADSLNLSVDDIDTHSLRSLLGIDIERSVINSDGQRMDGRLHAMWMHEYLDTAGTLQTRFGAAGSPAFQVRGVDLGRDFAMLGCGVGMETRSGATLFGQYDAQINDHQAFHVGSGGFQVSW